jgi:PIN domain nuclease of toxin-antitoxin system
MLGRLDLPSDFSVRVIEQGLALLDVTAEHAEALRAFPELTRHDPIDRLIVAQAAVERLTLLTADRVLLGLGRDFVVDATA